jgi:hypothetical protein
MMHYALCVRAALNDLDNLFAGNIALGNAADETSAGQPDYGGSQNFWPL